MVARLQSFSSLILFHFLPLSQRSFVSFFIHSVFPSLFCSRFLPSFDSIHFTLSLISAQDRGETRANASFMVWYVYAMRCDVMCGTTFVCNDLTELS